MAQNPSEGLNQLFDGSSSRGLLDDFIKKDLVKEKLRLEDYSVYGVAYSPDGTKFATGGGDGMVLLWDAVSGKLLRSFMGHPGHPTASCSASVCASAPPKGEAIRSIQFSKDGSWLMTATFGEVSLWNPQTGEKVSHLDPEHFVIGQAVLSPDASRILLRDDVRGPGVFDTRTQKQLTDLRKPFRNIVAASLSPDGLKLLTAANTSECGIICDWIGIAKELHPRWPIGNVKERSIKGGGRLAGAWFSPDGSKLLTNNFSDYRFTLWNTADWQKITDLKDLRGPIESAVWSPDGSKLLIIGFEDPIIYDVHSGTPWIALPVGRTLSGAFSEDGSRLILTAADRSIRMWRIGMNAEDERELAKSYSGPLSQQASTSSAPKGSAEERFKIDWGLFLKP